MKIDPKSNTDYKKYHTQKKPQIDYLNTDPNEEKSDADPAIRVINMPSGSKNKDSFVRTRTALIEQSSYSKISKDSYLSKEYERIMSSGE